MVRVGAPHRPSSASPRLTQDFEGHGLTAPAPCDRGYHLHANRHCRSETIRTAEKKSKGKNEPVLRIHAHVREKVITVNAGNGSQCIYWLGATAVHRYLSHPQAYTTNFSHELTAKTVLADDGAQLLLTARVYDELQDDAHVWIDVGDGKVARPASSRSFPERRIFEPVGDEEYQEQIGWRETEPDTLDDEVIGMDLRLTMKYSRTVLEKQPDFKEWQIQQPYSSSSQEGLIEDFNASWQQVQLDDMPGSTAWMNEVKHTLFHHFASVKYVFSTHAHMSADGVHKMTLLEFWAMCKRCAIPSPWANLAKINRMFATKHNERDMHNPQRELTLHEFMGALTRVSVLRQKNAMKPEIPLPNSLSRLIEDNILPLTPGFEGFEAHRAPINPFQSTAVRQKLTIHETRLKQLFRKWAVADDMHETINISEWFAMFAASGVMASDMTEDKLREAFVVAELGDHRESVVQWEVAGDGACCELIFPEFVEAVLRAAMLKFSSDVVTPLDLKIHEMCLLLVFGPAGLRTSRDSKATLPPLSGVERRN